MSFEMRKVSIIAVFLVLFVAGTTLGGNGDEGQKDADAAERVVQRLAKEAEARALKEAELKGNRPDASAGPTKVYFFVYVVDIDKIDGAGQSFTVNVYVRARWKDSRLAHGEGVRRVELDDIWNPRVMIANKAGGLMQTTLPKEGEIRSDGTVIYHQRFTGPISQPLKLYDFPFDEQDFVIQFVAAGYQADEIEFIPDSPFEGADVVGCGLYHELSLKDWRILKYQAVNRSYDPIKGVETAGFAFEFIAKRYLLYYIWQVITPLVFIVVMAWGAFYIAPSNAGAQLGVATSSMLTLIAYRFMLAGLIPKLPYMTRMDYFLLGSTILVFLTLVEVIITTNLALRQEEKIALKIDLWCRFIFPAVFVLWSVWSLLYV